MRLPTFIDAIRSYGCDLPASNRFGLQTSIQTAAGITDEIGTGNHRYYTNEQVRAVVAWLKVSQFAGKAGNPRRYPLLREAAEWLAALDSGWVVMSAGWVHIYNDTPPVSVFNKGAVCLPVPAWVH